MNEKSKNYLIGLLIIIIILLLGAIGYFLINNDDKKENNNFETNTSENNGESKKYKNYIYKAFIARDIEEDYDYIFQLEVKDGKLIATLDEEKINVIGINGKVKSFTAVDSQAASILVITEDNNLYYAKYDLLSISTEPIKFKKIDIDGEVLNITNDTCNFIDKSGDFSVDTDIAVLKNGKYKAIHNEEVFDTIYDNNNKCFTYIY